MLYVSCGELIGVGDGRRAGLAVGNDVRPVPPGAAARPGRHGRGLRGRAHRQAVDRGAEADVAHVQPGSGVPQAHGARSPHHRPAAGAACGADPRLRRDRRPAVLGDAPYRGCRPGQPAATGGTAARAARGGHHPPGRIRPGRGPRRRGDASRRQTAEHPDHRRRLRLSGRLRHRQRQDRRETHPTGHRGGDIEIHGARTLFE